MKIKDFLEKIADDPQYLVAPEQFVIFGDKLKEVLDELKLCEEFSDCTLDVMNLPTGIIHGPNGDDKNISATTHRLSEDIKYAGNCYLYSIALSPKVYEPDFIHNVKGSYVTPYLYSLDTFEPIKKIILEYDMIKHQDSLVTGIGDYRKELHDTLDQLIDNVQTTTVPHFRYILVRGYFPGLKIKQDAELVKTTK